MDESSPFMKQLVSSDRKVRDQALDSLRTYLTSLPPSRPLAHLDLLKLHKALFFAMWHQDRPVPQQKLARQLSDLALAIPSPAFLPYMRAFWQTIAREWGNIDVLRMDKFLRLVRYHVGAHFEAMRRDGWAEESVNDGLEVLSEWPLSLPGDVLGKKAGEDMEGKEVANKVLDGLRYHVLDVWVDELESADKNSREAPIEAIMRPITRVVEKGNQKTLRERARECAEDERLAEWSAGATSKASKSSISKDDGEDEDEEEFTGLDGG